MPIINKGTSFSNGEQLTADKINNLLDLATFNQSATDSASTTVNSASQIVVQDSGITTAKLATDAVETAKIKDANVTTAKIADANVTFAKLTDVIDSDTMTGASATTLATSERIKAYVDTLFGSAVFTESFESAETNIPDVASGITYTHGLSSFPKIIQVFVKCKVADSGYSIGDEVLLGDYGDAGQAQNAWASSTQIGWGHTYDGSSVVISDKNANVISVITSPNWLIFIRAYA